MYISSEKHSDETVLIALFVFLVICLLIYLAIVLYMYIFVIYPKQTGRREIASERVEEGFGLNNWREEMCKKDFPPTYEEVMAPPSYSVAIEMNKMTKL